MKQAILYARFSPRPNAAECDSIESQLADLRKYCKKEKIEIVGEYWDANKSGADAYRPYLWQAIDQLKRGQILLIRNLDRLARDFILFMEIEKAVKKKKAVIRSMNGEGTWNESPQDTFIKRLFQSLAEMQREIIRAKTKAKMLERQKTGQRMTRKDMLPYGQQIDPNDENHTIVNPAELEAIVLILELRAQDIAYNKIATALTEKGFLTRKGTPFGSSSIRKIYLRERD